MIPMLAKWEGLWWPASDTDAHGVITADCRPSIKALLAHVPGRALIVQAGGNVGTYPLALAEYFDEVWTFEPHPTNYECLRRNHADHPLKAQVNIVQAGLGESRAKARMFEVKSTNCGAHRIALDCVTEDNAVTIMALDDVPLHACDAIWLDIEGHELAALKGAERTIERFSPVIAAEDKGLHRAFGVADGALQAWLGERGYEQVDRIGQDKIFVRRAS